MQPYADLTEMEIQGLGYADYDDLIKHVEQARTVIGDKAYTLDPKYLRKNLLQAYQPKPTAAPTTSPPAPKTQEHVRLTQPREPVEGRSKLYEAAQAALARREEVALAEGTALTEGERKATTEYLGRAMETPRSSDAQATWSPLASAASFFGAPAKLVEALKPQEIMSKEEQATLDKAIADRQAQARFDLDNYYRQHEPEINIPKNQYDELAAQWTENYTRWTPESQALYSPEMITKAVKNKVETGDFYDDVIREKHQDYMESGEHLKYADPRKGLVGLISEQKAGSLFETPLFATIRGMTLPEAAIGAAVTPTDQRSYVDSISDRVAKGQGLEQTGQEYARYFGAEPGSAADDLGWWLGLGAGILLPADLGLTDVATKATKGVGKAVLKKVGVEVAEDAEEVALKKLLTLSDVDVADLKKADPSLVDLREIAARNADLIDEPHEVARVVSQMDVNDLEKISDAELPAYLRSKIAALVPADKVDEAYESFLAKSEALGLDTIVVGRKGTASSLPLGDSVLAWKRFLKKAEGTRNALYGEKSGAVGLRKAVAHDIVKHRITEAIASGKLPSRELTMITPSVAIPTSQVARFLADIRKKPVMQQLHNGVEQKKVTPELVQTLSREVPKSVLIRTKLYDAVVGASEGRKVNIPKLTQADWNQIIDQVVGHLAAKSSGGLTITEMATLAKRAEQVGATSTKVSEKLSAAITRLNLEKAFTPELLRPNGFRKVWQTYVSPVLLAYAPSPIQRKVMSPLEGLTRTQLVTKLGAIDEVYKADYDANLRRFNGDHEQALAATYFSQFQKRGADAGADTVDYEAAWVQWMAALYGGYDSVAELHMLRSGTHVGNLLQKEGLVDVFTKAWNPKNQETILGSLAAAFREASSDVDRLKALAASAKILDGRPLSTFAVGGKGDVVIATGSVGNKHPIYANALHVPTYASYIQQYQLTIMRDIRNQLISSSGALRHTSIKNALQDVSAQTLRTVDESISLSIPTLFGKTTLDLKKEVDAFVLDDYIHSAMTRVSGSEPSHVEVLHQAIKDKLAKVEVADESIADDVLESLGWLHDGTWHRVDKSSPGDIIFGTLTGQTNVALTEEELRAWAGSLAGQAKSWRDKPSRHAASAYSLLDDSGLYDLSEISDIVKTSVPLKDIETAFSAYEHIRDINRLPNLSVEDRAVLYYELSKATEPYTQRLTKALELAQGPDITLASDLSTMMQQGAVAAPTSDYFFNALPGFIKNNLLGGGWVPNLVYHFQNYISGPMILHMTLTGRQSSLSFLTDYNIFYTRTLRTPSGKVYNGAALDELMLRGGVSSSTVSAEIRRNMIKDMIEFGGKLPGGIETKRTFFKKLAKHVGFDGLSTFNQLAQHMDLAFRKKALAESLMSGASEEQAIEVARKALFDYSNISSFEREYVAKYLWFYRFMRANLVQTAAVFMDNPSRVIRMAKISKLAPSKIATGQINPDIQDYKDSRAFISLIEGQDKQRLSIYSPSMPVLEATAQMLDAMSFFVIMSKAITGQSDSLSTSVAIQNMVDRFSANPALMVAELQIQKTLGITTQLHDAETTWLDPRFVAWAKATGTWNTLLSHLDIEMVADDPRVGVTTFDGYFYKLQPESKTAWLYIMEALKVAGLQRSLRDYSTVLQSAKIDGMTPGTDIQTNPGLDILRTIGVIQVGATPSVQQARQQVTSDVASSLRPQK